MLHTGTMVKHKIKSGESDWTKENLLKLFAALKRSVPKRYSRAVYSSGLKHVNWNKVAFDTFSPEACQEKWKEVLQKTQKTRTLTELIDDAERTVSSSQTKSSKDEHDDKSLPSKPPRNGYQLFCKEQLSLMEGIPASMYLKVWGQRWKELHNRQRVEYNKRCSKLKKAYSTELQDYLDTFDEVEQQRIISENGLGRRFKKRRCKTEKTVFSLEPKMPFRSHNMIFCQRQMELFKEECPDAHERFTMVNKMWKDLSVQEKNSYKEQQAESVLKYSVELQKWFKTLSPSEQQNYRTSNPKKCRYLDAKISEREESMYRPSDSEDDDVIECTSREEEDNDESEWEEEDEDDNGQTSFVII